MDGHREKVNKCTMRNERLFPTHRVICRACVSRLHFRPDNCRRRRRIHQHPLIEMQKLSDFTPNHLFLLPSRLCPWLSLILYPSFNSIWKGRLLYTKFGLWWRMHNFLKHHLPFFPPSPPIHTSFSLCRKFFVQKKYVLLSAATPGVQVQAWSCLRMMMRRQQQQQCIILRKETC